MEENLRKQGKKSHEYKRETQEEGVDRKRKRSKQGPSDKAERYRCEVEFLCKKKTVKALDSICLAQRVDIVTDFFI